MTTNSSNNGILPGGAVVPATPIAGMKFLHTPTGRTVELLYAGGAWRPQQSFGSMTLFVDTASGSDSINSGTASGASAYATLQYAIDSIPGVVGGNVTISVAAGTYNENVAIQGKNYSGNYSITITGTRSTLDTLTSSASTQGSGSTQGTVVRSSGTWTSNQRQNKMVRFTAGVNSGLTRIIDSNTTTTITTVGVWSGGAPGSDAFVVEDWGTSIVGQSGVSFRIAAGQASVYLVDLKITGVAGVTGGVTVDAGALCTATNCMFTTASGSTTFGSFNTNSVLSLTQCFLTNATNGDRILTCETGCNVTITRTKIMSAGASTTYAVIAQNGAAFNITDGTVIDANGGERGMEVEASAGNFYTGNSLSRIRGATLYGMRSDFGGTVFYSASATYIVFSGNGTDTSANAATYSSIS